MARPRRRSLVLLGSAVFTVALAARLVPLHWSPLPATLDGFRYARLASSTLQAGQIPIGMVEADEYVFTLNLVLTSLISGDRPLTMAQQFVAIVGAATPLVALAIVRRLGMERGRSGRQIRIAAALAAFALAIEGLYLRRTGVPDEEALGLLLVPLLAVAVHRMLKTNRPAWVIVAVILIVVIPPLHNMTTLVAALTVTALLVTHLLRSPTPKLVVLGLAVGGGFWVYFIGYFSLAGHLGIAVTYSGLIQDHLGLFLAWLIVMLVSLAWFQAATTRARRAVFLAPIILGFLVVIANAFVPVFPGTVASPPLVMVLIIFYVVPVLYAGWAVPVVDRGTGTVILSLLAAPVILSYYALTTSLTPDFFDAVLRIQSFAHPPVMILAGLATAGIMGLVKSDRAVLAGRGRQLAIGILFIALVATAPLGYLNLDTGTYPSTTFESEFHGTGFATTHLAGPYSTDHTLSRVAIHYFQANDRTATYLPTREWLLGGPPPTCPVLAQQSWTTSGAHLYPTQPQTISQARFDSWATQNHRVYDAGGFDPVVLVRPTNLISNGCVRQ